MAITKTITKNGDLFEIKYTYPQDESGAVAVVFKEPMTLEQIDNHIAACQSQLADWQDTKTKCEGIE